MAYSVLGVLILVLDIYALYLIITSSAEVAMKLVWALVVIFLPVIGMILYFLLGRTAKA
jgi:hypothetical protein